MRRAKYEEGQMWEGQMWEGACPRLQWISYK